MCSLGRISSKHHEMFDIILRFMHEYFNITNDKQKMHRQGVARVATPFLSAHESRRRCYLRIALQLEMNGWNIPNIFLVSFLRGHPLLSIFTTLFGRLPRIHLGGLLGNATGLVRLAFLAHSRIQPPFSSYNGVALRGPAK